MRRLKLIMVNSESSYLSTCLSSNDQNDFGDKFRRLTQKTVFENVPRSRAKENFRENCLYIKKTQSFSIVVVCRLHENT